MKKLIMLLLSLMIVSAICLAQNNLSSVDTGNPQWIKLGRITLSQGGNDCFIKIIGGAGYNAFKWQQGVVNLHIRTSNFYSTDNNGYRFAATADAYGQVFLSQFRIIPNSAGADVSAYDIYGYFGPFPGNTFFTVDASPGSTWTPGVTAVGAADPGGYNPVFGFYVSSDTYFSGKVGIGTNSPDSQAQLAVKGTIHATEVFIDQNVPTPDYVFEKDYDLASLKDVKTYIDQNHHLPEIPSAAQVAKHGINLGEMNAKLLKKIEELTLYLIEQNKQFQNMQKAITQLKSKK